MDAQGLSKGLTAYGDDGFSLFLRQAFLASAGLDRNDLDRPIIGIADTHSDYTPCHRQMPELVQAASRGVLEAGGMPMVFPTMSLGEPLLSPTSMLYRNLMAMETEELIRAQPMDAVILLGGCDKTLPAQLMAAISADVPAISVVTGPMGTGTRKGQRLGACTDCRQSWAAYRAGDIDDGELEEIKLALCSTAGTCTVMGTASTMASATEALGLMLPGGATAPAYTGARLSQATQSGRLAVQIAKDDRRPSAILSAGSFRNALTVVAAVGGSTNALIHLTAMARRSGIPLGLDDIASVFAKVPLLVDCKPAGSKYMEDFYAAGGVQVLLKALTPLLDLDAMTITGETMGEWMLKADEPAAWQDTISPLASPKGPAGSLAVLRGSLAPRGAVLKVAAATPALLTHRGRAVVFDSIEDLEQMDDREIEADDILVLRNAGPVASGMPEAGAFPIPRRLARAGVKDMVRISDARMSGTAYGTVVLHVAPEAAVGGPLALVRDGDIIELDASAGRLDLMVPEEELVRRRATLTPFTTPQRGWRRLYAETVNQADEGADLNFLTEPINGGSTT
jgi:dihydroxy-acid dehydratase